MFAKYQITTFCAPPTMYRMLIKQDLSRFDLSSIQHASIAGEALNPEVFRQFEKATGMRIMEGFGQSESTLIIGNLAGDSHKIGSMGKPVPLYDVHLLDSSGHEAEAGDTGEICINIQNGIPCGLAYEYYNSPEVTAKRGTMASTTRATSPGVTRTASTGMSAVRMTSLNRLATASDRLKSKMSSWSCRMCSNAVCLPLRMRSAGRSSRPASYWSRAPRARTR